MVPVNQNQVATRGRTGGRTLLKRALSKHEKLQRTIEDSLKCIVALEDYTRLIKGRILYNHLFFSEIPTRAVHEFCAKRGYVEVVQHTSFSPRLIEFAIRHAEVEALGDEDLKTFLLGVLNDPATLWDHAFRSQLSFKAQTLLLAMLFLPPATPLDDLASAARALGEQRGGHRITGTDIESRLKHLDGTFISIEAGRQGARSAHYFNPAIADYLLHVVEAATVEVQSAVQSAVFFEQVLGVWSASSTKEDGSPGNERPRYPQLLRWVRNNACIFLEAIKRTWQGPSSHWKLLYDHGEGRMRRVSISLESRLLKVLQIGRAIGSSEITSWAEDRARELAVHWAERKGDKAAAAALVGRVEMAVDARQAVREWALDEIEEADDFEAAIRLREESSDIVDERFEEELAGAFDSFVETQKDYILHQADDASAAESALQEVISLGQRLGLRPDWYEDGLRERIGELGGREDDFDPDLAREAHEEHLDSLASEGNALDSLFDSLERATDVLPGEDAG